MMPYCFVESAFVKSAFTSPVTKCLSSPFQKAGGGVMNQSTPDLHHLRPPWRPPAGKLLLASFEEEAACS